MHGQPHPPDGGQGGARAEKARVEGVEPCKSSMAQTEFRSFNSGHIREVVVRLSEGRGVLRKGMRGAHTTESEAELTQAASPMRTGK
jgi:hypothetical protein